LRFAKRKRFSADVAEEAFLDPWQDVRDEPISDE